MVEWRVTSGLTDYDEAVRVMEQRAEDIAAGRAMNCYGWLNIPRSIPQEHLQSPKI